MRTIEYTTNQALIALRLLNMSTTSLAKELDVTPQTVYQAIRNPSRIRRVSARIVELIEQAAKLPDPLEDFRKAS